LSAELVVNSFWLLSILTSLLYITRKKYLQKKEFRFINKAFQISFSISIGLMILGFYLMVTKS